MTELVPDPRLVPLIAAPYVRARVIGRVERLVERYDLLLRLDAQSSALRGRETIELLFEHPSALHEAAKVDGAELERRRALADAELRNLRAAAPIPAPPERDDRALVLALADLTQLLREMRVIRRGLAKMAPKPLVESYLASPRARDPLDPLTPDIARAVGQLPRGTLLRVAIELAAVRHGLPDLRRRFLPESPPPLESRTAVRVCRADELGEGCGRMVEAFGRKVAVFRDRGAFRAIDDHCPHRGGPLHKGAIEGGAAVCPLHGWAFDLVTGQMRGHSRLAVSTYPIEIRGDEVFVLPSSASSKR